MVPEKLSIINKHKICGKRDKNNDFTKMTRPVTNDAGKRICVADKDS